MPASRLLISVAVCALIPTMAFAQDAGQSDAGLEEIIVTPQGCLTWLTAAKPPLQTWLPQSGGSQVHKATSGTRRNGQGM